MDRRPDIAPLAAGRSADVVDEAVFTSARSRMARGYRLVAASSGLGDDERREIVQRAPSHANLTDSGEQAEAAAGFTLRSGRCCLFLTRHDGAEPSGRGGLRVHTRVFVLAPATYLRFGCDPFRVARFAERGIDAAAPDGRLGDLKPLYVTPEVLLQTPRGPTPVLAPRDRAGLLSTLGTILLEQPTLVLRAPPARPMLELVLAATPRGIRRRLSFAHGMKPSPQRCFQLLLHAGDASAAGLFAHDHAYTVLDWAAPPALAANPFSAWLDFVQRMLDRGRVSELQKLADERGDDCTAGALARLAAANASAVATITPRPTGNVCNPPKPASVPASPPPREPASAAAPRETVTVVSRANRPPRPASLAEHKPAPPNSTPGT